MKCFSNNNFFNIKYSKKVIELCYGIKINNINFNKKKDYFNYC